MLEEFYYTIDSSKIVFEKFEDETVLINLENGNYYGIMKVGRSILGLLESGITMKRIVFNIATAYQKQPAEIEMEIQSFLDSLLAEGIIHAVANGSDEILAIDLFPTYEKPHLEKYTDMQDLILLDPVHDVNSKGWPNAINNPEKLKND